VCLLCKVRSEAEKTVSIIEIVFSIRYDLRLWEKLTIWHIM
jgi:hypothetical protein